MQVQVKVADEAWIACALLHRDHADRETFSVAELLDRARREGLTPTLRPGLQTHISQHCVANKRPNPAVLRYLYAPSDGQRRLFWQGDDYHEDREGGKTHPDRDDLPAKYHALLDWYEDEYNSLQRAPPAKAAPQGPRIQLASEGPRRESMRYKVVNVRNARELEASLNASQADGWRLVSTFTTVDLGTTEGVHAVLEQSEAGA
jgi:hypothetical protein